MTCVLDAETRGSRSVICRAEVPAARSWEPIPGRAVRENKGWEVVRVSTNAEVVRSKVRMVWSWEQE